MIKSFVEFLKKPGYSRFMNAWMDKYKSLNHLGGRIVLKDLTKTEEEALSILLSKPIQKSLTITYIQFLNSLIGTKFEGVDFQKVLFLYFGVIETNKGKKQRLEKETIRIENELKKEFLSTKVYDFMVSYLEGNHILSIDLDVFRCVLNSLNHLPCWNTEFESLAIFSQKMSGNPHYYDKGYSKDLLLKGIQYVLDIHIEEKDIESVNEILYKAGLLKDDLSNYCFICHLCPVHSNKWFPFYEMYEPWNMNLYNFLKEEKQYRTQPVLIIENPSVFRYLVDYIKEIKMNIGLVCSNGQINLCTYLLLDALEQSNCSLYYCGDFDPEGLLIAQKLKDRYVNLHLWKYDIQYLEKYGSKQESISNKRWEIISNINHPLLKEIAHKMKGKSVFCYQESLIQEYVEGLEKLTAFS